ncbi:MAG: DUF2179 domain-containing protein [Anaerolineales bacterium]|nr:DUF2179 domain-containing protein [Anaerolineales bacterium]
MPIIDIPPLTWAALGAAGWIFLLRVIGVTISTVRVLVMMRGRKLASVVMGFFEVLVYVVAIGQVVNNLSNVWNILGYCLGFSAGTLVGMWLDERTTTGFSTVRVISRSYGQRIADVLRDAGYGATVEWGHGREGSVGMVLAIVRRQEVNDVCTLADQVDPKAFVTIEEARAVRRGYMHLAQREK